MRVQRDIEASRLRQAIKESGMTQRAIAERVEVEESHFSRWVRLNDPVRPNKFYRELIAKELGVPKEEIWR